MRLNVALTFFAALIVTTHLAAPEHAPDQPANLEPEVAVAFRVTFIPTAKRRLQVVPHEMPAGVLVTVPLPVPALTTVRSLATANVAVTERAAVIGT